MAIKGFGSKIEADRFREIEEADNLALRFRPNIEKAHADFISSTYTDYGLAHPPDPIKISFNNIHSINFGLFLGMEVDYEVILSMRNRITKDHENTGYTVKGHFGKRQRAQIATFNCLHESAHYLHYHYFNTSIYTNLQDWKSFGRGVKETVAILGSQLYMEEQGMLPEYLKSCSILFNPRTRDGLVGNVEELIAEIPEKRRVLRLISTKRTETEVRETLKSTISQNLFV